MSESPELIASSKQKRLLAYTQSLNRGQTQRITVTLNGKQLTWHQTIELWQQEPEFRDLTTQILQDSPYTAFFWETPPLIPGSPDQPWEFVLVDAPMLAKVSPNPQPFVKYLDDNRPGSIRSFANLGRDAVLIVPCPQGPLPTYTHLANFVRHAPVAQVDALWRTLGNTLRDIVGDGHQTGDRTTPLWISTSGLGVYWLHIRLDDAPKYYTHSAYRSP